MSSFSGMDNCIGRHYLIHGMDDLQSYKFEQRTAIERSNRARFISLNIGRSNELAKNLEKNVNDNLIEQRIKITTKLELNT